jgi:hypothetical protein
VTPFWFIFGKVALHGAELFSCNLADKNDNRTFRPLLLDSLHFGPHHSPLSMLTNCIVQSVIICGIQLDDSSLPDDVIQSILRNIIDDQQTFMAFRATCKRFFLLKLEDFVEAGTIAKHWKRWFGNISPNDHNQFIRACAMGTTASIQGGY